MKFKAGPPPETTLDLAVIDMEVRFTPGGKRLGIIYAAGFTRLHIQMWDEHYYDCDGKECRLEDLLNHVKPQTHTPRDRGKPAIITVTGTPSEKEIHTRRGTRVIRYFTINTWESNVPTTPLPEDITEVPY
jgi:hypothetical protein